MEDVLKYHQLRLANLKSLKARIKQLELEIQRLLGSKGETDLPTDEQLHDRITLGVMGERNSGKSSLINELLGCDVLPVSEMAADCRVVFLKYSQMSYVKRLGAEDKEVEDSKIPLPDTKDNIAAVTAAVGKLIVRQEAESIHDSMVEIGLDDPLLQHGLEILEFPASTGTESLNDVISVVTTQLRRTIPLLVYVIDANMQFRPADRDIIQYCKDNLPDTHLFYVCNKADVDNLAESMDASSDESDDEVETTNTSGHRRAHLTSEEKTRPVLSSLGLYNLIGTGSDGEMYFTLMMKHVRAARRKKQCEGMHIINFATFINSLKNRVNEYLLTPVEANVRRLKSVLAPHKIVAQSKSTDSLVSDQMNQQHQVKLAMDIGNTIFDSLNRILEKMRDRIKNMIEETIEKVKVEIEKNADRLVLEALFVNMFTFLLLLPKCFSDDVAPDMLEVVYFTYVMKGVLLNGIIDTFRSKVKEESYKEMNNIISSGISEIAEIVADEAMTKDDIICMLGIRDLGTTFSRAAKTSLQSVFHEVFGLECIHKIAKSIPENEREDPLKVAGRLITGIDVDVITDTVIFKFMQVVKNSHETVMELLQTLAKARKRQLLSLQHAIMVGALLLPRVADIEIGMKSIECDMTSNRLRLGHELCIGRHSRLYDYTGGWNIPTDDPSGYIIRVIKRESGPAWNDTVVSLYHNSSLKQNDSLLDVVGWWMPDADTLYILMPKMEQSLDKIELSPKQIVQTVLDIAKGVHAIHDSGFSYNNLKTKNILVTRDTRARINTTKGKFKVLADDSIRYDVEQIGQLMVQLEWLQMCRGPPHTLATQTEYTDIFRKMAMDCINGEVGVSDIISTFEALL